MIINIILVILAVCAIGFIVNICEDRVKKERNKISFREAMALSELPVISMYQGDKVFNFLLDTGSNESHISSNAAKLIDGEVEDYAVNISGVGDKQQAGKRCKTIISYKDNHFDIDLIIGSHLDAAFKEIKDSCGVSIHGIIGNSFMQRYNYILDFSELTAYQKK